MTIFWILLWCAVMGALCAATITYTRVPKPEQVQKIPAVLTIHEIDAQLAQTTLEAWEEQYRHLPGEDGVAAYKAWAARILAPPMEPKYEREVASMYMYDAWLSQSRVKKAYADATIAQLPQQGNPNLTYGDYLPAATSPDPRYYAQGYMEGEFRLNAPGGNRRNAQSGSSAGSRCRAGSSTPCGASPSTHRRSTT